jgi:hypothetical protein
LDIERDFVPIGSPGWFVPEEVEDDSGGYEDASQKGRANE